MTSAKHHCGLWRFWERCGNDDVISFIYSAADVVHAVGVNACVDGVNNVIAVASGVSEVNNDVGDVRCVFDYVSSDS